MQDVDWNSFDIPAEESTALINAMNSLLSVLEVAAQPSPIVAADRVATTLGPYSETTILLAEDNAVNRLVAEGMLRQFHCQIDMAENGEQAVQKFQEQRYDLIFMDCQMPVLDGFDAVAKIRELESESGQQARTPSVALTANALKGDRDRCLSAGMDDYVSKPFSIADLRSVLDRQLGVDRTSTIRTLRLREIEDTAARAQVSMGNERFVDTKVLEAIRSLTKSDGEQLVNKVAGVFLDASPRLVADLDSALAELSTDEVRKASHSLRSCCSSIGATRLADLSKSIENLGDKLTVGGATEWREQLRLCHDRTAEEIRQIRGAE